jgi:hypothetical protein
VQSYRQHQLQQVFYCLNSIFKNKLTYLSSHFSQRTVCSSKTQPTTKQTANPTIDPTVDPKRNPSAELSPTPTATGILLLEVNIKKQK